MIVVKFILMFLFFLGVPISLGHIVTEVCHFACEDRIARLVWDILLGCCVMWGIFQLLAVPNILAMNSMRIVTVSWCMIVLVMLAVFAIRRQSWKFRIGKINRMSAIRGSEVFCLVLTLIPIAYQCYLYVFRMHLDEDDSRFIANAVSAYETNRMLLDNPATGEPNVLGWVSEYNKDVVAPWPIFLGMASKLIRMHPAIFAHTVYAPYLLLLSYGAFFLIGYYLFQNNRAQAYLFVAAAAMIQLFFSGSTQTQAEFILVRIWQGKATFAAIIIPLIMALFLFLLKADGNSDHSCKSVVLMLGLVNLASCLLSSIGVIISMVLVVSYGAYYILLTKKWKAVPWFAATCLFPVFFGGIYYLLRIGQMVG